jgi:hypothetical protein
MELVNWLVLKANEFYVCIMNPLADVDETLYKALRVRVLPCTNLISFKHFKSNFT